MERSFRADLLPLPDDEDDAKIMQLVEDMRHDDERETALAELIAMYNAKADEMDRWSAAKAAASAGGGKAVPSRTNSGAAAVIAAGGKLNGASREPKAAAHIRHLRTLLRLSVHCPHQSIREGLTKLLERLKASSAFSVPSLPRVPESLYVDPSVIPSVEDCDDDAREEFIEAFRADGRVSHMTHVMAIHPKYLARFREVHNCLLWGEGPLPLPERQLIAIMASGRHQCQYLAEIHTKHFLDLGGDPKWLERPVFLPPKLRSLLYLNSVLAHQPWLLKVDDIAALVKSGVNSWSLNELVQAIAIMVHFHALQGFVLGVGVTIELDLATVETVGPPGEDVGGDLWASEGGCGGAAGADDAGASSDVAAKLKAGETSLQIEDSEEVNLKAFADAETEEARSPQQQLALAPSTRQFPLYECSLASAAAEGLIQGHVDFNIKSKDYSMFHTHEFSWSDQCYSTMSRHYPEIADLFDAEFQTIKSLTYGFIGNVEGVNTFQFRWAVWNYAMRTKGVVNDEYMYKQINGWLDRSCKSYIKTAVCYPQLSSKMQFRNIRHVDFSPLKDSERVHINLLATSARKQAGLLYAMRAVSQFMARKE